MATDDISTLTTLRQVLGFHNARQTVIANNIAHANTPGFVPEDLNTSHFERALAAHSSSTGGLRTSDARHYGGASSFAERLQPEAAPDSETTANGNAVVIEEQMVRANDNRMRFETALSLYQKSLNMLRVAAKPPSA